MKVELLRCMGDDLMVVNTARVSYDNYHTRLTEADYRLIRYLATNKHISPFFHPQIQFRITSPLAVAAQLKRHQIGLALNEVSRRYVSSEPVFEWPLVWREKPSKGESKQGSGSGLPCEKQSEINLQIAEYAQSALVLYNNLLDDGVAPEQARFVLPVATETQWIWTGSLYAFIRIMGERLSPNAQHETRWVAEQIRFHLGKLFPKSMRAWGLDRPEDYSPGQPLLYGPFESERLSRLTWDEAIEEILDQFESYDKSTIPESLMLYQYAPIPLVMTADSMLDQILERVDEELGNPDEAYTPTVRLKEAAEEFVRVFRDEYKIWAYEQTGEKRIINPQALLTERKKHREQQRT